MSTGTRLVSPIPVPCSLRSLSRLDSECTVYFLTCFLCRFGPSTPRSSFWPTPLRVPNFRPVLSSPMAPGFEKYIVVSGGMPFAEPPVSGFASVFGKKVSRIDSSIQVGHLSVVRTSRHAMPLSLSGMQDIAGGSVADIRLWYDEVLPTLPPRSLVLKASSNHDLQVAPLPGCLLFHRSHSTLQSCLAEAPGPMSTSCSSLRRSDFSFRLKEHAESEICRKTDPEHVYRRA